MRRKLFTLLQWLLAAAVIWYAVRALRGQWSAAADRLASLDIAWPFVALATALVLATFLLLIDAWRRVIEGAGDSLSLAVAARIWFISNLGKYVPGKVWSIAAMTMMSRAENVAPLTAAGSSILMQLVTIATGIGVVLVAGARALDEPVVAVIAGLAIAVGIGAVPAMLPRIGRAAGSVTGRVITLPQISSATIWIAAAKSALSWIIYGVAFQLFVRGVLGSASGDTSSYIAVYSASYIIGFLALFAPGGAVVRESAMIAGMLKMGLAGQSDAVAVAVASRVWLTATELLPGLVYLALGRRGPKSTRS